MLYADFQQASNSWIAVLLIVAFCGIARLLLAGNQKEKPSAAASESSDGKFANHQADDRSKEQNAEGYNAEGYIDQPEESVFQEYANQSTDTFKMAKVILKEKYPVFAIYLNDFFTMPIETFLNKYRDIYKRADNTEIMA